MAAAAGHGPLPGPGRRRRLARAVPCRKLCQARKPQTESSGWSLSCAASLIIWPGIRRPGRRVSGPGFGRCSVSDIKHFAFERSELVSFQSSAFLIFLFDKPNSVTAVCFCFNSALLRAGLKVPRSPVVQSRTFLFRVSVSPQIRLSKVALLKRSFPPLSSVFSSANLMTTTPAAPVEKFRKDYKVPNFSIHAVDLTFKIFNGHTQVRLYLFYVD